ncbi:hypothetical protein [Nitrosomonas sp.]|uniref:hypothetical protein n=1 Tax=Nitrosomonas sp. TaxID=42353 RepID=UPI0025FF6C11|nr:hypothetical protein [Nitrosomonas sp.]
MKVRANVMITKRKLEQVFKDWNATAKASENAPGWLYFLAKHFGEKQEFNTCYSILEVRQFFGVQYLIYK